MFYDNYKDLDATIREVLTESVLVQNISEDSVSDFEKFIDNKFKTYGGGRGPTIGKTYLMKAPNGKPLFYTVNGVRSNKLHGRWGILEFGRPFSNDPTKQWYIPIMNFSNVSQTSMIVSPKFAEKALTAIGVSVAKMPVADSWHKYDDFEEYKVLN